MKRPKVPKIYHGQEIESKWKPSHNKKRQHLMLLTMALYRKIQEDQHMVITLTKTCILKLIMENRCQLKIYYSICITMKKLEIFNHMMQILKLADSLSLKGINR